MRTANVDIMSPTPIRIALLICDTPLDSVVKSYGEYHSIFSALLTRSLPEGVSKDSFVLDPYDVEHKMQYPTDLGEYDAIMLTGSSECTLITLAAVCLGLIIM